MIINGKTLLRAAPIRNMVDKKRREHGVTSGMSEAGYDIRIEQEIWFAQGPRGWETQTRLNGRIELIQDGRFVLASAMEEFVMPNDLVGIVHDKSTWARSGLSVFNTVIEPGWKGFLTLELVYHGNLPLVIPAGSGIAQVVFHKTSDKAAYTGRYQHQAAKPIPPISSETP